MGHFDKGSFLEQQRDRQKQQQMQQQQQQQHDGEEIDILSRTLQDQKNAAFSLLAELGSVMIAGSKGRCGLQVTTTGASASAFIARDG